MTTITDAPNGLENEKFDRGYKWLHWTMTVLILLMFFAIQGFATANTPEEYMTMLVGHSSIGTLIITLLVIRVSKRFIKRDPIPVQNIPPLQKTAAKIVQLGLYFSMIFVPVTGYLTASLHEFPVKVFATFDINQAAQQGYSESAFLLMRQVHEFGIKLLIGLLVLHIGAALYHKFVKKDDVMASIVGFKRK